MKWEKCGKIFDCNTFELSWFKKNAIMPVPYILNKETLRLFVTLCDEDNIGRIGYVDVCIDDPGKIVGISKQPIIDIGNSGYYDDNGVVTASIFEAKDNLYLFYSAFQLCKKIPYMIFSGAAVSHNKGNSFEKIFPDIPMLDRISGECNFRSVPNIIKHGTKYKMWYLADDKRSSWLNLNNKLVPRYTTRYMESDSLLQWDKAGEVVLDIANDDEYGLSISSIWYENEIYKCIYSIRSRLKGYRLGYAVSKDGKFFERKDNELNLDVTPDAFDSDMMCYAKRIEANGQVYLFYSGNHYGLGGIGYAKEARE